MYREQLGEAAGQRPPLATGARQIEHCVKHLIQIDTAWARALAGALQQGADGFKLLGADVAGVIGSHGASSLAPASYQRSSGKDFEQVLGRLVKFIRMNLLFDGGRASKLDVSFDW